MELTPMSTCDYTMTTEKRRIWVINLQAKHIRIKKNENKSLLYSLFMQPSLGILSFLRCHWGGSGWRRGGSGGTSLLSTNPWHGNSLKTSSGDWPCLVWSKWSFLELFLPQKSNITIDDVGRMGASGKVCQNYEVQKSSPGFLNSSSQRNLGVPGPNLSPRVINCFYLNYYLDVIEFLYNFAPQD